MRFGWLIGAILAAVLPASLAAQSPFEFSAAPTDAPALIDADQMTYDEQNDVVTATGNVTLLEPGGEVVKADSAELTDGLKRATAANLGFRLSDGSRMVGREVSRESGVRTTLTDGAFTPCEACAEDPERAPVWRLRARKVEHDEVAKDINYEDVTLDVMGVPVAYLPYFSHPDPTVDRRTGFLAPTLFFGGEFDAVTQVPYYWNIAPDKDLTLKPYFTVKSLPVAAFEYRQLFDSGRIAFDASIGALDRETNAGDQDSDTTRGHAFADGEFALDDTWRLRLQGRVASDDSYLETFKIDNSDVLRNQAAVEGFWREGYVRVGAYGVQDLRENTGQNDTPFALPELRGAWQGAPTAYGNAFVEGDARVLGRERGTDGQSVSATVGWRAPVTTARGHRLDLEASLRGDAYHTNDGRAVNASGDQSAFRGVPRLVAGWRYPVIQQNGWGSLIVEPRAQAVLSLDQTRDPDVPNEDARAIEFDESNFYRADRFPGRDRVDDGQRIDYGVTATALFPDGGRASAFVGQSTSRTPGDFASAAAMRGRSSDIVTAVNASPAPWLDVAWRTRLKKDDFGIRRNEIAIGAGPEWLRADVSYVETETEIQGPEVALAAEQINAGVAVRFNENWRATARHQRDLRNKDPLLWSATIAYEDECVSVDLGFARDFASQADGGGREDTVFLRVNFKHLGGLGLSQGVGSRDGTAR